MADPNASQNPLKRESLVPDQEGKSVEPYDPLKSPPDIQKAIKHARARKVGHVDTKQSDLDVCEDCGLPTKNEPLHLTCSRLDLADLGPGFPLYYEYVLFCGILLLGLFFVCSIYGIIANKAGGSGADVVGTLVEYSLRGRSQSDSSPFLVSAVLALIYTVVGLAIAYYYRRVQSMTADEVNRGTITASDYTVMIEDLPTSETKDDVIKYFEEHGKKEGKKKNGSQDVIVKKAVLAYKIGPYLDLVHKKDALKMRKLQVPGDEGRALDVTIDALEKEIDAFEAEAANNTSSQFTGIAFITFNTEKAAILTLKRFKKDYFEALAYKFFYGCLRTVGVELKNNYKGKIITMDRAPEPLDVFWENLGYKWFDVMKKRVLTLLSSIFLIGASFGLIYLINTTGKKSGVSSTTRLVLSIISSFLITVINGFIGLFIRRLSGFEKHTTYTYYFMSIANKLSWAQFLNTALVTFFVVFFTTEKPAGTYEDDHSYIIGILVTKVFYLFLLNMVMPSITYFLNPFYLIRMYKRSTIMSEGFNSKATQQQANMTFEGPPFDIAQRYANVQKTMLFTGFYASLVPIGVVLSIIGLFLTYWTDKYMLLRRHSRPNSLGKQLAEQMCDFLELFFVAFCAGNLLWDKIWNLSGHSYMLLHWIGFGLAFAAYVIPHKFLALCIVKEDEESVYNEKTYEQVRFGFVTEYDRVNPITQDEAMQEYLDDVEDFQNSQQVTSPSADRNMNKKATFKNATTKGPNAFGKPAFQNIKNMYGGGQFNRLQTGFGFSQPVPMAHHLPVSNQFQGQNLANRNFIIPQGNSHHHLPQYKPHVSAHIPQSQPHSQFHSPIMHTGVLETSPALQHNRAPPSHFPQSLMMQSNLPQPSPALQQNHFSQPQPYLPQAAYMNQSQFGSVQPQQAFGQPMGQSMPGYPMAQQYGQNMGQPMMRPAGQPGYPAQNQPMMMQPQQQFVQPYYPR